MGAPENGLPDLPPEWGDVVIPDDLTELDTETHVVQRELRDEARAARRAARRRRWRRRLHLPDNETEQQSLLAAIIVVTIAVLVTLLSLLLVMWPALTGSGQQTPAPSQSSTSTSLGTATPVLRASSLAALDGAGPGDRERAAMWTGETETG